MSPLLTIVTLTIGSINTDVALFLKEAYTSNCLVHSRVWKHMVGVSKNKTKPDHMVYSLMGKLRIFYESIGIFKFILKFILIFYFYCMKFSN